MNFLKLSVLVAIFFGLCFGFIPSISLASVSKGHSYETPSSDFFVTDKIPEVLQMDSNINHIHHHINDEIRRILESIPNMEHVVFLEAQSTHVLDHYSFDFDFDRCFTLNQTTNETFTCNGKDIQMVNQFLDLWKEGVQVAFLDLDRDDLCSPVVKAGLIIAGVVLLASGTAIIMMTSATALGGVLAVGGISWTTFGMANLGFCDTSS